MKTMRKRDWMLLLGAAMLVAVVLSPFASQHPDGLERVAENIGFLKHGEGKAVLPAPIPDYAMPGIKRPGVATAVAGVSGTLVMFGLGFGITRLIGRRRST